MDEFQPWCRITVVGSAGDDLVSAQLAGHGQPAIEAVEEVARYELLARRAGGHVRLSDLAPAMEELIVLSGLAIEVIGESEEGEDAVEIEQV